MAANGFPTTDWQAWEIFSDAAGAVSGCARVNVTRTCRFPSRALRSTVARLAILGWSATVAHRRTLATHLTRKTHYGPVSPHIWSCLRLPPVGHGLLRRHRGRAASFRSDIACGRLQPRRAPAIFPPGEQAVNGYREIDWEALIPPAWDPKRALAGLDLSKLNDNDPEANEALARLRGRTGQQRRWRNR